MKLKEWPFRWVSGVRRDNLGNLLLEGQDINGLPSLLSTYFSPEYSLQVEPDADGTEEIYLNELRLGNTADYLDGLGLSHLSSDSQAVYVWECKNGKLFIPAQVLIHELMVPRAQTRWRILSSHSPRTVFNDDIVASSMNVWNTPTSDLSSLKKLAKQTGRYFWISHYPSASRAWASVYRHALNGRLDMTMPMARVRIKYEGRRTIGGLFVTRLRFRNVTPIETPPFALGDSDAAAILNTMISETTMVRAFNSKLDQRLNHFSDRTELNDAEWDAIQPILQRVSMTNHQLRAHPLRTLIGLAAQRIGNRKGWEGLNNDSQTLAAVRSLHYRLRQLDIWEDIVVTLSAVFSTRVPASQNP